MLLTITTTYQPATDLGFLLHKHPDRYQTVDLSLGKAHIFYPEVSEQRTTIALLLDINPIDMVRGKKNFMGKEFSLKQYVNDRPYVASSFLSVALSKAFSTAMNGTCTNKPELATTKIPLEVQLAVVPAAKGGEPLIKALFEPLGYEVAVQRHQLDEVFTSWGESKYYSLQLKHNTTIQEVLSHLYVLIPALDNDKHYFVSKDEIDKLLAKGEGWLAEHPKKQLITRRYLKNLGGLVNKAIDRLTVGENSVETEQQVSPEEFKKRESLHQKRLQTVFDLLKASGAKRVVDMGCGEGKLIRLLMQEKQFQQITGMDVVYESLVRTKEKLYWDRLPELQKGRIELFQGSLTYRDRRLEGFDAAAIVEVIEHMEENRIPAFERVVFEFAKPKLVLITTPNSEYNVRYERMNPGQMRHDDHRFEWTRAQFESWAKAVAGKYNYSVEFKPIGEEDEKVGAPSQLGIFTYGN